MFKLSLQLAHNFSFIYFTALHPGSKIFEDKPIYIFTHDLCNIFNSLSFYKYKILVYVFFHY